MKINSDDYRVIHGTKVKLDEWPTIGKPICASKREYRELLDEHVKQLRRGSFVSGILSRIKPGVSKQSKARTGAVEISIVTKAQKIFI